MVLLSKKKLLLGFGALILLVIATFLTLVYLLTDQVPIEYAQDPNAVEAHEANRKLKLLNEAQANKRKGFIRLTEVEINSFLDGRYHSSGSTNKFSKRSTVSISPDASVERLKTGVLLTPTNITLVTWHTATVRGFNLPIVWQRTVIPVKEKEGWSFELQSMQIGRLQIPEVYWERTLAYLGGADSEFTERKVWLANLPEIALARNEQSRHPELRLYSFDTPEKDNSNERSR